MFTIIFAVIASLHCVWVSVFSSAYIFLDDCKVWSNVHQYFWVNIESLVRSIFEWPWHCFVYIFWYQIQIHFCITEVKVNYFSNIMTWCMCDIFHARYSNFQCLNQYVIVCFYEYCTHCEDFFHFVYFQWFTSTVSTMTVCVIIIKSLNWNQAAVYFVFPLVNVCKEAEQ